MRGRQNIRPSVLSCVVDESAGAIGVAIENEQTNAASQFFQFFVATEMRQTRHIQILKFSTDAQSSVVVVYFVNLQFAGKIGIRRFLVFDNQFVATHRRDGKFTAFLMVLMCERTQYFSAFRIVKKKLRALGDAESVEDNVQ